MLRYFKRNLPIAVAAGLTSILTHLSTPVAAMLEQRLVDNIIARDFQGFSNQLLYSGLLVLVSALLYWLSARTQKQFQVRFEESLRNDLFEKAMSQPHSLFQQTDTAQQMSFIRNEASVVSTNLTRPVFILVGYFPMAAAVLLIMFHYSPLLALLAIACAAISILPPLSFNRRLSTQLADKLTRDADLTFQLKETLGGHETISAFQALPQFLCRFFSSSRAAADAAYRLEVMAALLENAAYVIQKFVWFVTFLVAGRMAVHQQISVGTLMMFVTLLGEFCGCVTLYAQTVPLLLSIRPEIQKISAVLDHPVTAWVGDRKPTFQEQLDVRELYFGYTPDVTVLKGVNLTLRHGEKTVLLGSSGGGKSTLIRLLSGSDPNYTGFIAYDGTELHSLNISQLSSIVTVIHQNTFLFNDSILFNITLGQTFSPEILEDALVRSGVSRFLPSIPGGLDASCGENGARLSGGQKQRIAIARALIRNVHLLILDEGVSAIDVEAAKEIERELLSMKELTLLTITHRLRDGLIDQYDQILLLENGKVRTLDSV